MSSDTLCTHVKGIGCWRCSTLITPTLVRESGLADLDQCGKDLLVSNPYTPCDVISEGKIGSAILEEKDEVLSSGWFKVRGFKRQRLNGPAQICSPDDPVRAEKRCAIRKRRSFTKTSGPSEKATCSQATVNTQENVYRDPPATPVSVNQELHENRGIEFMIKGLNVHTIGDFYVIINDAVHISDKPSVAVACRACEEDARLSSRDGANTNRRRDGLKDPGLVTHRLAHPELTEAGGTREEDDNQYPSRDGAFITEMASGAQEEDEKFLSWDGVISTEKAGEARAEDARFSSRDGANTNRRRDGLKDPGLVTHKLAHPDLMKAGGAREEDDKQFPSRDGAFRMEEDSGAQEEDERFLTRDGEISLEMAGRAREMDARFPSREGANMNWRRDGLKDPVPVTLQLEHPDLMEAGGAPEEDEWLLSREGTCNKEVVSGAPEEDERLLSREGALIQEAPCGAREEDKQLSSRERASTTRWRVGLNNLGLVTHRLEHPHILKTGGAREENDKQLPPRDGAFMMQEASGAQQDDQQLSSKTEEGCEARVEDKLFSAREDANTLRRSKEPGPHRTTRPDRLGASGAREEIANQVPAPEQACGAREEARANTKAEMGDRAGENATDTAAEESRAPTAKRPRPSTTPARTTRRNSRTVPCPALIRNWINDASIASTRPSQWNPPTRESTPSPCPSSTKPTRFPRLAKKPLPEHVYPDLLGISRIFTYLGKQRHHELGCGPSGHPGAGLGIWALSPLLYGTHGTRWQDNILCQYGGRTLPLEIAERDDYLSDYVIAWPEFGEAIN